MLFFDAEDTLALASDLHLDRTATSNLLLGHSSVFWDTRSAIRTQILNHPPPPPTPPPPPPPPPPPTPPHPAFQEVSILRLRSLRGLCEANVAKLILLVPPT